MFGITFTYAFGSRFERRDGSSQHPASSQRAAASESPDARPTAAGAKDESDIVHILNLLAAAIGSNMVLLNCWIKGASCCGHVWVWCRDWQCGRSSQGAGSVTCRDAHGHRGPWPAGSAAPAVSTTGAAPGYSTEEFFVSGAASSRAAGAPTQDGHWQAAPAETAPYVTRIVVVRPSRCP